jgi:hypothetical protein
VGLEVTRDTALGRLDAELDGDDVLVAYPLQPGPVTVAGEPGAAGAIDFSGDARLAPTTHRFCTRITQ